MDGSGKKTVGSTAFGMTETAEGCMLARSTVFSLLKQGENGATLKPFKDKFHGILEQAIDMTFLIIK